MLPLTIVAALLSAAVCYAVGYAIIAPRDSALRTKRGLTLLVIGVLSIVTLPPQLPALGTATALTNGSLPDLGLAWPEALDTGAYIAAWLTTSLAALLLGMRIWKAGRPGWRAGSGGAAYDSSASGRAAALIVMADGLDDVFDALRRTGTDAKGVERIAEELRSIGRRFASELPGEASAVYALVASKVTPALAPGVTRHLLEGAGRSSQIARPNRN
jgi:hypothetical protein